MDFLNSIIIGVLQGIIEWLPISSQGSLMIYFSNVLNISPEIAFNYSIFLHLGTVLAALVYFRKKVFDLFTKSTLLGFFKNPFNSNNKNSNFLKFLIISVIFTLLISVPIYFFIGNNIGSLNISLINLLIGILLIITGGVLLFSNIFKFKKPNLSIKNSIFLGLFQGLSVLPGISRSGMTTSVLLFEGFSPEKAFEISFILAIPTVLIGEIGIVIFNGIIFNWMILISLLTSFIIGYLTIGALIRFAKKIDFSYFCFILGLIYIFLFFI